MNAITDSAPRAHRVAPHPTHTFKLLLKREYWEHRGGFLWAPLIAGGIALLFAILGAIGASALGKRHGNDIQIHMDEPPAEIARVLGAVGDMSFLGGIGIAMMVLGFVVFFYCLASLYDDRKDRSVLFWKSLPVSDTATVASKAAWALLLAPLVALVIGLAIGLGLWIVALLTTTVNGVPGTTGLLTHSHPIRIALNVLAMVPLYALWALPTVGWLMLCSAAARSKPFLWAVMIPVVFCALVSFSSAIGPLDFETGPLWYVVAYRGLLSAFPGTWLARTDVVNVGALNGPEDLPRIVDVAANWSVLGTADLWIGVVAGLAMIAAAIRLRRWRDEG